jgi:hypothetical protein
MRIAVAAAIGSASLHFLVDEPRKSLGQGGRVLGQVYEQKYWVEQDQYQSICRATVVSQRKIAEVFSVSQHSHLQ